VTLQHGSDKLILNFGDYETTEECEPQPQPTEANIMPHAESLDSNQIRKTSLAIRNFAAENIRKRQDIDKLRYDCKHRHVEFNEVTK